MENQICRHCPYLPVHLISNLRYVVVHHEHKAAHTQQITHMKTMISLAYMVFLLSVDGELPQEVKDHCFCVSYERFYVLLSYCSVTSDKLGG